MRARITWLLVGSLVLSCSSAAVLIRSPVRGQSQGDAEGGISGLTINDLVDLRVLRNVLTFEPIVTLCEELFDGAPCQELRFVRQSGSAGGAREYQCLLRFNAPGVPEQRGISIEYEYDPTSGQNPFVPPDACTFSDVEVIPMPNPDQPDVPDATCYRFLRHVLERQERALFAYLRPRSGIIGLRTQSVTDAAGDVTCFLHLEVLRRGRTREVILQAKMLSDDMFGPLELR